MTSTDTRSIVFNVAAGVVTVAALAAVVRSFVFAPGVAPCTARYTAGTLFGLDRGGVLLTATDLQGRLGGKDVGLGDNIEIARIKDGPSPVAMGVHLAKGSASPHGSTAVKGGVSFPWEPRSVQGKTSACLAYNVLLPADFEFHRGGVLPGIRGSDAAERHEFDEQLAWRRAGRGGVSSSVGSAAAGTLRTDNAELDPFAFPTGRWVKLEQEVVLNTPAETDGVLRVWLDGSLVVDRSDMSYRTRADVTITGVGADVFYTGDEASGGAPKDAVVWLSPMELRWQ